MSSNIVEQQEIILDEYLTEDNLSTLKKSELIRLILDLNDARQKEDRQKEWGHQFDIWLIRAARKNRAIEFSLSIELPVISSRTFIAIPRRVDKYEIQVELVENKKEIWITKSFIVGCWPTDNPPAE